MEAWRRWRLKHPLRYRRQWLKWYRKARNKQRDEIFRLLGGKKCRRCGYKKDWRALQVDHIRDDGARDRRYYRNGIGARLRAVRHNPSRYQVLCANCNVIKEAVRRAV